MNEIPSNYWSKVAFERNIISYFGIFLELCHAYGTFTNTKNLYHVSFDFRLCRSFDH